MPTYLGVHIRCTDRRNPFDKYLEIIDNIVRNDSEICIFLATDNYHVQNHLKKIYGERVVFQQKWFPKTDSTIDRLHFNPDCPDKLENAFQALVDMYLLANCDYLVCNQNSTFSLVAELISDIPEKNIFDTSQDTFKGNFKQLLHLIKR